MTKLTTKTTKPAAAKVEAPANHHDFYRTAYFTKWAASPEMLKLAGPVPAMGLIDVVHAINHKRPGVEALHIMMALRPKGCTVAEFCAAGSCGPANNYRRHLVTTAKVIKVEVMPGGEGRAYAYKATLTAKGLKLLADAGVKVPAALAPVAADKPAKAARKRPAKPAAAEKAEAVSNEAAQRGDAMGLDTDHRPQA